MGTLSFVTLCYNGTLLVLIRKYYLLSLIFRKPLFNRMDVWTVFWCVGITGELQYSGTGIFYY